MSRRRSRARGWYRVLLRAWPRADREEYGSEMEEAFAALLEREGERHGQLGRMRVWAGAAVDAIGRGLSARWRANEQGGGETMGTFFADMRYAARSLKRQPVFAATAMVTIALGIGANTTTFTVVNGFMFRPLPYENPEQLVALWSAHPELGWSGTDVNPADVWDWDRRSTSLAEATVFEDFSYNLTGQDQPERIVGLHVTPNFLSLLGWQPALGRDFAPDEIGEGRDEAVILLDGFWERRFGRASDVLGSTLTLDGNVVTVVGILPPTFLFHDRPPDLLRPWGRALADFARGTHGTEAIGRLAEGATPSTALEELRRIAADLAVEYPENDGWTVEVVPLKEEVVGDVAAAASVVLMSAVGFILLMACVNVANLLLARAGGRAREIEVRLALGAGRGRIARQLFTENLVLALAGGAMGFATSVWGSRALVRALPPDMPPVFTFEMDTAVLLFTAGITVGSALLFGMLPALRMTADPRGSVLRAGTRSGRTRGASRFGSALIVTQTSLAVVLLVGGGLLMKSMSRMQNRDFGFNPENVITARLSPPDEQYPDQATVSAYWEAVTQSVRGVPGVVEVGTTQSHPLMGSNWGQTVRIAGQDLAEDEARTVRLTIASPGLFEALRFRMVQGRTFNEGDASDAPRAAIVNEAFVERYLGSADDPLAQTLSMGDSFEGPIVGVVHDIVERAIDSDPEPALYVPMAQQTVRARSLVIRTTGSPTEVVDAVQEAVWGIDADIPLSSIQTMTSLVEDRVAGFAVIGYMMGFFALLSLILGAVGIYGVTAYAAGQRAPEIGLRLAMGAERADVVSLVVRQGARRAALGLALGLVLALGVGGPMTGVLVDVSPRDPSVFATVTAILAIVSFLGLWIPARRASQVDPVQALTAE